VIKPKNIANAIDTAASAKGTTTCAWQLMACITAPNAAKPATFRWRILNNPYPMQSQTITLRLDPDDRLAAAIGGAIRYLADTAGLENDSILQLQSSVLAACKQFFDASHSSLRCEARIKRVNDRLEVELKVPETALQQGAEKLSWPGVDEVHAEAIGTTSLLRLIKRLPNAQAAN
jgi:hypothetical protein